MNRALRTLLIAPIIIVVLAGLGYAAHTLDLVGLIARMHTPPQH